MQTDTMRERQLNIRLSPEEGERLDLVAKHYGLNGPGVLRMLVKREHDMLTRSADLEAQRTDEPSEREQIILSTFAGRADERLEFDDICVDLNNSGWRKGWSVKNTLIALSSAKYVRTLRGKTSSYSYGLTAKGKAYVESHWRPVPPRAES
jgi:hypothetical protein